MVQCKEEVFDWFKDLSGATRIELMCGLLNLCIPLEWRFFATVIENLARRDYASLKDYEIKANSAQELDEIANSNWLLRGDEQDTRASTNVSAPSVDKQQPVSSSTDTSLNSIRSKIVVYMCLLSSSNRVCATLVYKSILKQLCAANLDQTLAQAKKSEKFDTTDAGFFLTDNLYNEIILLHTLARFHPAFTFEQQSLLGHQLQTVQHWMDMVKFTAAAGASGTIPTRHPLYQQQSSQYQQTQQFHHPFQSTNKQQHLQYQQQMQPQQYSSHLHSPNEFNQPIANMSLPNNNLSVLPPYTLQVSVASPPGFENQSLSPGVCDYSQIVGTDQKSGRKDVSKDTVLESDEEVMRGVTKELRSMSFGERVNKDSSVVTNGDLNEYKKSNLDNSKPSSPLGSTCSSNSSSSPVSSASNSLNGAIVSQQHSTPRHVYVENLLKKENLRRYKEKIMSINPDELWNMSVEDFEKLGLTQSAAVKLNRALLSHANYNGVRLHTSGEVDISDSLPHRSSSPSVSPSVSLCSEKGFDGVGDNEERVATYLKTQDAGGATRTSLGTKAMSNQKWSGSYIKAVPNASASTSSVSTLASTNKQQTASKSSSLSSVSTGSETSAKASKTLELSAAGSTGSNRVPWKSVPSTEASAASVNKCANCGSSNCICSVSNGSSVATTPSSTPPPAIPAQQMQPGMVHMSGQQSMIHPYWLFLPPPPFPSAINGYSPGSHSELLNWYTLAVAAASAGMSYWPNFSSSLAFPGSIPGFPSAASVHGGNQSLMAGGTAQSKVSCYNCGGIGHRGNECSQQSLDDVVKPSTFNMNFTTPPEFDTHVSSHNVHHSTYPNQAPHVQPAPHTHQASYHYSTSPPHNFQEHSVDRSASRHGTHPHT